MKLAAIGIVLALAPFAARAAAPAPALFETKLGLTPIPDGVKPAIAGTGHARATLAGQMLTIDARFTSMGGPATGATLMRGPGIGIPGAAMLTVPVTPDAADRIAATVKLSRDQAAALRAGHIYLQIDSAKSPAPAGHLWGWLLPAHAVVAEDEPQAGGWYLPQGAGLKAAPARARSGRP